MNAKIDKTPESSLPEKDSPKEILSTGENIGLRIWRNEEPNVDKEFHRSPYETVGYVLKGKAELHIGSEVKELSEGDAYFVPKGAEHKYEILETFSAVEATSPPAHLQ